MVSILGLVAAFGAIAPASAQGVPGVNVNAIGPTPDQRNSSADDYLYPDYELRQQNEPNCAVRPDNRDVVICGYNDYRATQTAGDAWQGVSMSRDGGLTWTSRLAPGYRGSPQSLDVGFAADPSMAAVPGLALFNFIATNRDGMGPANAGGVFLQRWVERNKEDSFPWVPERGTLFVSKGSTGRFLDKPNFIATLAPPGSGTVQLNLTLEDNSVKQVKVPAGELHLAYSVFVGNDNNDGTKILYTRSTNYGASWEPEAKLTEGVGVSSGISLTALGDTLVAVWRRRLDTNEQNSVMVAVSRNRGQTWGKATVLSDMCPFDQATTSYSFRTNAFPVAATDGTNFYVYWADRRFAGNAPIACPAQDSNVPALSRIVMSKSTNDGRSWSAPQAIDNPPAVDGDGDGVPEGGHQYMPAAFGATGTVQVTWYDTRDDEALQYRDTRFVNDVRYTDAQGVQRLRRHTVDLRGLQVSNAGATTSPSVRISRYRVGVSPFSSNPGSVIQVERNYANTRLFKQGKSPFMGDYNSVAARAWRIENTTAGPAWVSNSSRGTGPIETFYTAWSDARDARGNTFGTTDDQTATSFTPAPGPTVGEPGDPVTTPTQCVPGQDRTRDQNIYTSSIRPRSVLTVPSATKPTGAVQRAFVLNLQNPSPQPRTYELAIKGQPGDFNNGTGPGFASFLPEVTFPVPDVTSPLHAAAAHTRLTVVIDGGSSASRTVFVNSDLAKPLIPVEATEEGALVGAVTLNANPTVPGFEAPDYVNPDNVSVFANEVHDPLLVRALDYNVVNFATPGLENPDLENPSIENPNIENPNIENPSIENPGLENPDLENPNIENPSIENPSIENPGLENAAPGEGYTEVTWVARNVGNTTTAYSVKPFIAGAFEPSQLIVHKIYTQPSLKDCQFGYVAQNQVLVNMRSPDTSCPGNDPSACRQSVQNPGLENPDLENAAASDTPTFFAAPGEEVRVTLRVFDPSFNVRRAGLAVYSQACNTSNGDRGGNCQSEFCVDEEGKPCEVQFDADTTAPVWTNFPATVTAEATGPAGGAVSYSKPTAADGDPPNVDTTIAVDCAPASGSTFELGETAVQCVATDDFGNATLPRSFTVEVKDTKPPTLNLPADISVPIVSGAGVVVNYVATATDLVDTSVTPVCVPASGSSFALGETTVNCTATDDSGNSAAGSFKVTVRDGGAPTLVLPADITVTITSGTGSVVNYVATASDTVDPDVTPVCVPASGSSFALGETSVSCTATDDSGNSTTGGFKVTVRDGGAPTLVLPADITVTITSGTGSVVNYVATATDAIDASVTPVCAPASGSTFAIGATTVNCSATDDGGNATTGSFKVTVTLDAPWTFRGIFYPKGNISVGSTVPLDWYWLASANGPVVDSSASKPAVVISGGSCGGVFASDSGSSDFRYSTSDNSWRFNWQTKGCTAGTYSVRVRLQSGVESPPTSIRLGK